MQEGQWGLVKPEDYKEQISLYQQTLDEEEEPYGSEGRQVGFRRAAEVRVVATANEAEKIIKTAPLNERIGVVIFISRGMERIAEKLAATYPKTKVIVFTGLIPEGKVIWVSKAWATSPEAIQNIVLHY